MRTLMFCGSSDDTFGLVNDTEDDYDNCASGKPIEWLVESASEDKRLIVFGQFAPYHGTGWLLGAMPHDPSNQDVPMPNWPTRIRYDTCPYSPMLEIDVPDDATVRCLQRGPDAED